MDSGRDLYYEFYKTSFAPTLQDTCDKEYNGISIPQTVLRVPQIIADKNLRIQFLLYDPETFHT